MGFILDGILEKLEEMEELEDVLGLAYVSSGIEIVDFAEGVIVDDDGDGSDKLDEVEEEDEYVTTDDAGMDESDWTEETWIAAALGLGFGCVGAFLIWGRNLVAEVQFAGMIGFFEVIGLKGWIFIPRWWAGFDEEDEAVAVIVEALVVVLLSESSGFPFSLDSSDGVVNKSS